MKNILFILSALFFTLIFATCKKDPKPGKDDFYFQCKINGKTYIPGLGNGLTCELLTDTTLILGANLGFESVLMGINDGTGIGVKDYLLNDVIGRQGGYDNSPQVNDIYKTDSLHTGQLHITTLDKTNKIIQGTFFLKHITPIETIRFL